MSGGHGENLYVYKQGDLTFNKLSHGEVQSSPLYRLYLKTTHLLIYFIGKMSYLRLCFVCIYRQLVYLLIYPYSLPK